MSHLWYLTSISKYYLLIGLFLNLGVFAVSQEMPLNVLHLSDRIETGAQLVDFSNSQWRFRLLSNADLQQDTSSQRTTGDDEKQIPKSLETSQVIRWGSWPGVIGHQAVCLTDGSWLAGEIEVVSGHALRLKSRWLQVPEIPLSRVRAIVWQPTASLLDWLEIVGKIALADDEQDVLWLSDKRQIAGVVDWTRRGRQNDQLTIKAGGEELVIPWSEIAAFVASPVLLERLDGTAIQVGLKDGTLLNATAVQSTQRGVAIKLPSLDVVESLDWSGEFCRSCCYICSENMDKAQRLDQEVPARYQHIADNQLDFSLGVNRDVYGGSLVAPGIFSNGRQSSGVIFHGLSMHSSSQVAYRWDQSPARFLAEIRMARPNLPIGDVVCRILLARGGKIQEVEKFQLRAGGEQTSAKLINIDLAEAQLLVLVVEKGLQGQYGDQVFWLDPRIAR